MSIARWIALTIPVLQFTTALLFARERRWAEGALWLCFGIGSALLLYLGSKAR